jgi:hypothetical protein
VIEASTLVVTKNRRLKIVSGTEFNRHSSAIRMWGSAYLTAT